MHAVHTTPGLIVDSRPYGEAGKLISIFTRDFGLICASARGIRFERSKLRYFAQDHSFGSFSLVRGKEFWRLTSAGRYGSGSEGASGAAARDDREGRLPLAPELIARMALLLRRLLQGEEANAGLFACVETAARFIQGNEGANGPDGLNEERLKTLESLIVIRIMHRLGYIGDIADLNGRVASLELSAALLDDLKEKRISMNQHVNKALKASHL